MKIKKILIACILGIVSICGLTGCDSSDKIKGEWIGLDYKNQTGKIVINDKEMKFGKTKYKANQTTVGFKNDVKYYGLELTDGNGKKLLISIVFPKKDDKDHAILMVPDDEDDLTTGGISFIMSKKEFKKKDYTYWVNDYFKINAQ